MSLLNSILITFLRFPSISALLFRMSTFSGKDQLSHYASEANIETIRLGPEAAASQSGTEDSRGRPCVLPQGQAGLHRWRREGLESRSDQEAVRARGLRCVDRVRAEPQKFPPKRVYSQTWRDQLSGFPGFRERVFTEVQKSCGNSKESPECPLLHRLKQGT